MDVEGREEKDTTRVTCQRTKAGQGVKAKDKKWVVRKSSEASEQQPEQGRKGQAGVADLSSLSKNMLTDEQGDNKVGGDHELCTVSRKYRRSLCAGKSDAIHP